jgi:hypothetical protein
MCRCSLSGGRIGQDELMAIPDHVKKQAMDAVSSKETTAQIRLYRNNDAPAQTFSESKNAPAARGSIPDHVKKQAMDSINCKETVTQMKLVKDSEPMSPLSSPSHEKNRTAERIAEMQKSGQDVDSVQRQATKDGFERAYG